MDSSEGKKTTEATELLAELHAAMGAEHAPRRGQKGMNQSTVKRAAGPLAAMSDANRIALYRAERVAALPTLRKVIAMVRELRTYPPLREPGDYAKRWGSIISTWNRAVRGKRWHDLAPLCTVCGVPVFVRGGENLGGGNRDLSTVCSPRCQKRAKDRK